MAKSSIQKINKIIKQVEIEDATVGFNAVSESSYKPCIETGDVLAKRLLKVIADIFKKHNNMFYIVKEVKGMKYYWNKRKFHWEGLLDNGHGFPTQEQAESYLKIYQRTQFQDATIQMHVLGSGVS